MSARKPPPPVDRDPLLTTAEVAERLNLSESTVARMARKKVIPSYLIGTNRRFKRSEIDRFIDRRTA